MSRLLVPPSLITSPISSLPNEILILIFNVSLYHFSLADVHGYWTRDASLMRPIGYEYVVSSVCKRWREIALGNSLLWTNIHITPTTTTHWVSILLERSKTEGLYVSIDTKQLRGQEIRPEFNQGDSDELIRLAFNHCHRFRCLALRGAVNTVLPTEFRSAPTPELKNLSMLYVITPLDAVAPQDVVPVFTEAPSLRELSIGIHSLQFYKLNITSLTSLVLQGFSYTPTSIVNYLNDAVHLERLEVDTFSRWQSPMRAGSLKLPSLNSIKFDAETEGLPEFFESLSAPRLTKAHLHHLDQFGGTVQITSPHTSVTHLELSDLIYLRSDEVSEALSIVFRIFPAVTNLIFSKHVPDQIFSPDDVRWVDALSMGLLSVLVQSPAFLPQLDTLTLSREPFEHDDTRKLLVRMITSRATTSIPLKVLRVPEDVLFPLVRHDTFTSVILKLRRHVQLETYS